MGVGREGGCEKENEVRMVESVNEKLQYLALGMRSGGANGIVANCYETMPRYFGEWTAGRLVG